jgi:CheY-like chemotaxis protein
MYDFDPFEMDYFKSPTVFVVDKNPIHNSLIKYHLNANKFFNVHTFPSGNECLYKLNKQVIPDFIITDYEPGDNSGFEFLQSVRELSSKIQIVFFSSYDDPILADRLLNAGATDYVVKTNRLEIGITELIKNVKFLVKEEIRF